MVDVSALALVGKTNEATDEADDIECCDATTNDGRLRTASRFSRDAMMTMLCGRKIIMRVHGLGYGSYLTYVRTVFKIFAETF